jgi:hypothetical protein
MVLRFAGLSAPASLWRDYLSLTVSFDHRMIDGAPAGRFTERLKELIESGCGLPAGAEPGLKRSQREVASSWLPPLHEGLGWWLT